MGAHYRLVRRVYDETEIEKIIDDINNNVLHEYGLLIKRVKLQSNDDDFIYTLDKSEIKCDTSEIGRIVLDMNEYIVKQYPTIELNQIGLPLESYYSTQEKVNTGEYELLLEDILLGNKSMKASEKIEKIHTHLNKTEDAIEELIITDPYIFAARDSAQIEEQLDLLTNILERLKPSKIIFITNHYNAHEVVKGGIVTLKNYSIEVKYSTEWHDRFWIKNRSEGIIMGTSLNGIGSKITSITKLNDEDVNLLINYMKKKRLISREIYKKSLYLK
ncbi:hypothetical protein FYW06_08985 [Bacillus paranthracis]|uniref:Guanylate kinase-like domain-containing protein n=1 Tax=Bacillus paranthracis TaxID=2026186 RepID=A0A5M9GW93_9BACI|nr:MULTISPECIES: hypothetical protein [Bacillus cereus group]KAA8479003.1 hypothetical protein FYW06_08985 [Bacillus paranthracis]MDZ4466013.1 hypothetical protein [Bacillus cereus]MDZ4550603.1 hypothetical protein [Bacillus cereus]QPA38092.1 hypothetical protein INR14_21660 [Bacillus paranthracis]QPA43846.1 hypothetical protein INQ58_21660 [Bacillus cereus]